jgi:hypothetical protein
VLHSRPRGLLTRWRLHGTYGKEPYSGFLRVDDNPLRIGILTPTLAHIGLGRALALSGDTGNAEAAYRDFLALWSNADSDIPTPKLAKAEYSKLKRPVDAD